MKPKTQTRPSLFDIQVNGFAGVDFQNMELTAADLRHACEGLRRHHTHRILLTLVTDTIDALEEKFAHIESLRLRDPLVKETVVGYHLEGPYMSPEEGYRGAHPAEFMKQPDLREFRRLQKASGGNIRLVTIAPEWPGSARFIAALSRGGVVVSLGHTNASNEQIDAAIKAGALLCTHLGNGSRAMMNRHDNIIQRLLARDELIASFIPDGIHIPPPTLKNFLRAKPPGKIILSGDPVAAAGAPPGVYIQHWGRKKVEVVSEPGGLVHLPGNSDYLAGSSGTLETGVADVSRWASFPEPTVWDWASLRPAKIFGIRLPRVTVNS
jgi:N-acetylglucosamine-6-phosphate deacetylase